MHISINGTIITEEKAYIHIKDRGFLLGDGIFETCKVQNGHIQFFDEHYSRLEDSAKKLFISFNYSAEEIKKICDQLIQINNLGSDDSVIRITLTRGIGLRGINLPEKPVSTLLVTTAKFHVPHGQFPRIYITSIKRNALSPITKFKTLNYLEPILARQEAQSNGFDEGLMLNTDGYVTECSIANIFFVKKNRVITPSLDSGVLPGIMRDFVIHLCKKNNIVFSEKLISQDEAMDSDEIFQTNSLIGIQPISAINNKKFIVDNYAITQKLIRLYEDEIKSF